MSLQWQDSELIEFAKQIELTSTEVLEGMHSSARGGEGIEYHSTLPYAEGEDARRLDWKRVAATDRYFVNRFEREEKTSWSLLIDGSKSMGYGKKSEWANLWAGSLLFLAKAWGDRWRLLPNLEGNLDEALEALATGAGAVDPEKVFIEGRSTERLVVLSDFFWDTSRLQEMIRRWKEEFRHLYLIQILDPQEAHFAFSGVVEFRDLESSEKLILDAGRVALKYRKALKKLQEGISSSLDPDSFLMSFEAGENKLKEQILKFFEAV